MLHERLYINILTDYYVLHSISGALIGLRFQNYKEEHASPDSPPPFAVSRLLRLHHSPNNILMASYRIVPLTSVLLATLLLECVQLIQYNIAHLVSTDSECQVALASNFHTIKQMAYCVKYRSYIRSTFYSI
jgi:hypothetical protein